MSVVSFLPTELQDWCNQYLETEAFKDYSPNGLQVDAAAPIRHIITGVTASQNLIDSAIKHNADAILVHHGYFWKGEAQSLVGMKGKRIRTLLKNDVSLLAYHLPLDAHPIIGNNAILAKQLGLMVTGALYSNEKYPIGNVTECAPQSIERLIDTITAVLHREPLYISGRTNDTLITKIGICTGGAQDMIEQAATMGCQVYISGEISERTTHFARELAIDYLACGHHATEIGGIKAFGELIEQTLGLDVTFIDDSNPA